jgi:hypothetical protein
MVHFLPLTVIMIPLRFFRRVRRRRRTWRRSTRCCAPRWGTSRTSSPRHTPHSTHSRGEDEDGDGGDHKVPLWNRAEDEHELEKHIDPFSTVACLPRLHDAARREADAANVARLEVFEELKVRRNPP